MEHRRKRNINNNLHAKKTDQIKVKTKSHIEKTYRTNTQKH